MLGVINLPPTISLRINSKILTKSISFHFQIPGRSAWLLGRSWVWLYMTSIASVNCVIPNEDPVEFVHKIYCTTNLLFSFKVILKWPVAANMIAESLRWTCVYIQKAHLKLYNLCVRLYVQCAHGLRLINWCGDWDVFYALVKMRIES